MVFIKKQSFEIKKKTTNVITSLVIITILLIGNTLLVVDYSFNIQKSFAREGKRDVFSINPFSNNNNNNSPTVHTSFNPVGNMDPTALSIPFSGAKSLSNGISSISHYNNNNAICNIIKGSGFSNSSSGASYCKSTE